MKIGTPFKADTLEITLCSREIIKNSMNVSTLFRFCNIERLRIHVVQVSFNRSYVIHLAGHLRTAILTDTVSLYSLSKDHTGNTMQTGAKMTPFVRIKNFKKRSTLSRGTYSYSPYEGPPPRPPRSAVSKSLLERLSLTPRALTSNGKNETFAVCL